MRLTYKCFCLCVVFVAMLMVVFCRTVIAQPDVKASLNKSAAFEIVIENRRIQNGLKKITVMQGQQVTLRWLCDEAVDIHLHGYDIELRVAANIPTEMSFVARATGRFPITSHGFGSGGEKHRHGALLYLEVYPE